MFTHTVSAAAQSHPIMFWICIGFVAFGCIGLAVLEGAKLLGDRLEGAFKLANDPREFERSIKGR